MTRHLVAVLLCSWLASIAGPAIVYAQSPAAQGVEPAASSPVPPVTPAQGGNQTTDIVVTAHRIAKPLTLDGRLDEDAYTSFEPTSNFFQQEPREGDRTTERTDIWVLFDDDNLYVVGKCFDSHPERDVLTEMRRDNRNIFENESFTLVLDTFHDLRNGFMFQTNPLAALRDQAIIDDTNNQSWNTVWEVRTGRYDWGYAVEMAIPFKSLRYAGSGPQVWGINVRRVIKWKNEYSYITKIPASFGVNSAASRMGSAATLVGVETPGQSMNLELKPYGVISAATDHTGTSPYDNRRDNAVGFDFKYGLTRGLILDTTVHTDFSQVEEDQQQVNLTRFSLFFPEKRDFFLEGQGVFAFGSVAAGNGGDPGDVPILFFSRRIGLNRGLSVPVLAGGRVTGRAGKFQIGALNIETDDKPAAAAIQTNFTALRVKRDVLRRSNIGFIATRRAPTVGGRETNLALGGDMNLFLFANLSANVYVARTDSPGQSSGQESYRGRVEFSGDRYGWTAEHLLIGPNFNPEVGFVRRTDFRRSFAEGRFSPRPRKARRVRKYTLTGSLDYVTDASMEATQNREWVGHFLTDYQNADALDVSVTRTYELVPDAFAINPGTVVKAGGYSYQTLLAQYTLGPQRPASGKVFASTGTLYGGKKTEAGYSGRLGLKPQFAIEPSVSLNWVRLPVGDFSAPVVSSRVIYTPNTRTAISSLVQYNGSSHTLSSSLRLRWEYKAGSELFIVYSDGRDTLADGYQRLLNRSVTAKVTRLLRF